jgi:hypothetical protein
MHFSTQPLTGEMKYPRLYLCLVHSIPSPLMLMQHMHQPITKWYDPLHIISHDHIGSSILISLALHHCVGPSAPSLAQASPSHAVPRFKASNLPFTLATGLSSQVMSWSSPPWSHDSMSCLTCNKLLHHHMCKLCNISKPFSPPWHMFLTHMYLWNKYLSHILQRLNSKFRKSSICNTLQITRQMHLLIIRVLQNHKIQREMC